jgi:hypothetical protein
VKEFGNGEEFLLPSLWTTSHEFGKMLSYLILDGFSTPSTS